MTFVAVLWVYVSSPAPDTMNTCGLVRVLESSRVLTRCQNKRVSNGKKKQTCVMKCRRGRSSVVFSSLVANHAGEMRIVSEEKVYNVVLRQAVLVNKQLRSTSPVLDDVKKPHDIVEFEFVR